MYHVANNGSLAPTPVPATPLLLSSSTLEASATNSSLGSSRVVTLFSVNTNLLALLLEERTLIDEGGKENRKRKRVLEQQARDTNEEMSRVEEDRKRIVELSPVNG